ncbi:ABC transporter G family member 28-like [Typha angustifolia]|uniref:ABC transporter G family member 28-like n=1 Tax=Typha angustifolia TaxID=59011 RepID=UPI003C2AFCCA
MRDKWAHLPPLAAAYFFFFFFLLARLPVGQCQLIGGPPPPVESATQGLEDELAKFTRGIANNLAKNYDFCINDPEKDLNDAFNFTSDPSFVVNCMKTDGDFTARLCTQPEIKFYFSSLYGSEGGKKTSHLKPNNNCNLTSWVPGCEPGWACSINGDQVDPQDISDHLPPRTLSCRPCCEGFFCPSGITCMIPCPLGAYCPLATLNETTGVCDPYNYQLPAGKPNHTCGTADKWADVGSAPEIFCPAGSYCPSTIQKINCTSGHYCRMGTTHENKCFRKDSCKPNSAKQHLTIVGALLIVAFSLLLLVIYNFSDQFLTYREKRKSKSREAGAKMAKDSVVARERWKGAKDIAMRHVNDVQTQLSRTFSKRKPIKQQDFLKDVGHPLNLSELSTSNNIETNYTNEVMHSIEEDAQSDEDFNLEIKGKKSKKDVAKGKHKHTRTQIFKYAYGQIEMEKALQQEKKNFTFSGVISLATENKARRPMLEVAFKDLTLTLGTKKLLRSITGKLMPGRIAAVMGPSGAGKTTFLNALSGKATGCKTTGLVLVNGKVEPIRSYKKIIGFVPQDDIVHGNLTVEENLWFSAKCRLSAGMSKADKVLVVERVIESLGLEPVRSSLVGTVEKRGISGGQRKRVNVGLEMVMEPSLLILDEPTSGLDSASSQLLLRALRREALEGVNICMVVHQPSYSLFKTFDDLILLAKGGLIVYHGSVNKVEEYFAGLGINVPDRVNPPDYFIDILEGIVKPSTSTSVTRKQLPLQWMLHNGYEVPPDMQDDLKEMDESMRNSEPNSARSTSNMQSVAGELFGNISCTGGQEQSSLSKSNDLTNRRTPSILTQYRYYLGRVTKQRLREARLQAIDFLILGLAGICLGTIAKVSDESFGAAGYVYTVIAVSLLCQIGALRSFSVDRLEYQRERESGMSTLAYFLSKDTIDHFNTVVKPIFYLSMYYFFNSPRSSFADNYIVLIALVYCVTGIGYTFAICFQPASAQLWSALLPVVLTLLSTQQSSPKFLTNLCYPKWAVEAFIIITAKRYSGVWMITRCGVLLKSRFNINDWGLSIAVLFIYGAVFRFIAFICLLKLTKK